VQERQEMEVVLANPLLLEAHATNVYLDTLVLIVKNVIVSVEFVIKEKMEMGFVPVTLDSLELLVVLVLQVIMVLIALNVYVLKELVMKV
jgi:hypothetical protein